MGGNNIGSINSSFLISNSAPFSTFYVDDFRCASLGDTASFHKRGSTSPDILELTLSSGQEKTFTYLLHGAESFLRS